jgi:hypothetical protein
MSLKFADYRNCIYAGCTTLTSPEEHTKENPTLVENVSQMSLQPSYFWHEDSNMGAPSF